MYTYTPFPMILKMHWTSSAILQIHTVQPLVYLLRNMSHWVDGGLLSRNCADIAAFYLQFLILRSFWFKLWEQYIIKKYNSDLQAYMKKIVSLVLTLFNLPFLTLQAGKTVSQNTASRSCFLCVYAISLPCFKMRSVFKESFYWHGKLKVSSRL